MAYIRCILPLNAHCEPGHRHKIIGMNPTHPASLRERFTRRKSIWLQTELPWWRHQMETFSALLAICAGNSPVPGEFPTQRPVARSFDVYFDLRLNKQLSKQSWGWWLETPSRPLWRHRNDDNCLAVSLTNKANNSLPILSKLTAKKSSNLRIVGVT